MTDKTFYTATMAKVQEDQDNFDSADQIYRHLLEREPDNEDFRAALNRIANRRTQTSIDALSPLLSEWISLLFEYKKIKTLRKMGI